MTTLTESGAMPIKRLDDELQDRPFYTPPIDTLIEEFNAWQADNPGNGPASGNWPPVPKPRPRDTSLGSTLRYGIDQMTDNIGLSLKHQGLPGAGGFFTNLVDPPPGNYQTAGEEFENEYGDGYKWSALARSALEQAPSFVVSNSVKLVPGVGHTLAYGHGYMQAYGPILEARAKANGGVITDADRQFAHNAAIALGAIDAVGFGGLAKPAGAIGRAVVGTAAKAGSELAEKVARTTAGKMIGEAIETVAHSAPVDKIVTVVAKPAAEVLADMARSKSAKAVGNAILSTPAREAAKDGLVGGLESGAKSILEQTANSADTRDGLRVNPSTVVREAITGAGLEIGKGLLKPARDMAGRHLTPEHRLLLGETAGLIAASKALEKLQASKPDAIAPAEDQVQEMARLARQLQAAWEASSDGPRPGATYPADETVGEMQPPPITLHGRVWSGEEADQPPPLTRQQLDNLLTEEQRQRYFGR